MVLAGPEQQARDQSRPAGPQLQALDRSDQSGPCRTSTASSWPCPASTASSGSECSPPDLNHKESPKIYQIECQKKCKNICQKVCQNRCQIECQNVCQKVCQMKCQTRHIIYTSRWYVGNYVRIVFQGGDHSKKVISHRIFKASIRLSSRWGDVEGGIPSVVLLLTIYLCLGSPWRGRRSLSGI